MGELFYETLHEDLAEAVPEFRPEVDDHLSQFEAEGVLPHLLFGDLTRFVLSHRQSGGDAVVGKALAFLELAAQSKGPRVENVVAASFVENIGRFDPEMSDFIAEWPPHLQAMARSQGWQH